MMSKQPTYQIRLTGHLGDQWSAWFAGMTIHRQANGETVLIGELQDQTALHGVLMKIRDLGLPLVEVKRLERPESTNPK